VGRPQLAVMNLMAGGLGPQSFTSERDPHLTLPTDWSSDGHFVGVDDGVGQEQHTAWIADLATHRLMPLLEANFAQWGIAFAPDVKRIAFVSTESGRPEIYVQSFEASPASPNSARREIFNWMFRPMDSDSSFRQPAPYRRLRLP
jgi:Tol biopolymer transport system component